jgi:UDP-glucose 4-epimerase
LEHINSNPNLTIVQSDINDYEQIAPHFVEADYVFHLAALADIVPSINHPQEYHRANVDGTFSVLEACKQAKHLKKFLYTASSSCYGIPDNVPTKESAEIRTEYPYALTKFVGERYAMHWAKVYDLPAISLRLFNVYGPRSRTSGTYGAVFGVFLAQKLANKPFTVVGDGKQTRDFTFVKDVVNAFYTASQSSVTNEVFNVGSGQTYAVNHLIELLGGPVTYIPKRPGEPDCTFADTSKIKSQLKWQPEYSLEQGVKIMLEHIEYWREAPVWTPDSIKTATADWFKYLGKNSK